MFKRTTLLAFNDKIAEVTNEEFIKRTVAFSELSPQRIKLLHIVLQDLALSDALLRRHILAASMWRAGFRQHEKILNSNDLEYDFKRNKQYILAGDYYNVCGCLLFAVNRAGKLFKVLAKEIAYMHQLKVDYYFGKGQLLNWMDYHQRKESGIAVAIVGYLCHDEQKRALWDFLLPKLYLIYYLEEKNKDMNEITLLTQEVLARINEIDDLTLRERLRGMLIGEVRVEVQ